MNLFWILNVNDTIECGKLCNYDQNSLSKLTSPVGFDANSSSYYWIDFFNGRSCH